MNSQSHNSKVSLYLTNGKYDPRKSEARKAQINQDRKLIIFVKSLKEEIFSLGTIFKILSSK